MIDPLPLLDDDQIPITEAGDYVIFEVEGPGDLTPRPARPAILRGPPPPKRPPPEIPGNGQNAPTG
jgi:hypothetical protein